jgi:L-lactate dehydrogenase complex protein LldG
VEVAAVVSTVASIAAALDYVVDLCAGKEACQWLLAGCEAPLSAPAENLCATKAAKVLAAPGLAEDLRDRLAQRCRANGIHLAEGSLRQRRVKIIHVRLVIVVGDTGKCLDVVITIEGSDIEIVTAHQCAVHLNAVYIGRDDIQIGSMRQHGIVRFLIAGVI